MRYRGINYHVLTRFQDRDYHVLTICISYKGTKINKNTKVGHFFLILICCHTDRCIKVYHFNF